MFIRFSTLEGVLISELLTNVQAIRDKNGKYHVTTRAFLMPTEISKATYDFILRQQKPIEMHTNAN